MEMIEAPPPVESPLSRIADAIPAFPRKRGEVEQVAQVDGIYWLKNFTTRT
jgi:hypothetical protein